VKFDGVLSTAKFPAGWKATLRFVQDGHNLLRLSMSQKSRRRRYASIDAINTQRKVINFSEGVAQNGFTEIDVSSKSAFAHLAVRSC